MVNSNNDVSTMAEGDNAFEFFRSDDLIGNQNIPNASGSHDFGFSNFGTCDPDGAGFGMREVLAAVDSGLRRARDEYNRELRR